MWLEKQLEILFFFSRKFCKKGKKSEVWAKRKTSTVFGIPPERLQPVIPVAAFLRWNAPPLRHTANSVCPSVCVCVCVCKISGFFQQCFSFVMVNTLVWTFIISLLAAQQGEKMKKREPHTLPYLQVNMVERQPGCETAGTDVTRSSVQPKNLSATLSRLGVKH